jgi:hypothetical protein
MEGAVSVVDPDEEPLTRKRVLNHKIRTTVSIYVKCQDCKRGQVGRKADSTDTMRSKMNLYPEALALADKKRTVGMFVVIEIGGSDRWAKEDICRDRADIKTSEGVA